MTTLAAETVHDSVTIRALGGFRVFLGGRPVPLGAWQSKKARDLLKLLVARRGRPAPRDCLVEALWPEDDPRKTANRLSVALSTVRSVLDPEHRFEPEHYISASRDAVALETSALVLDLEAFLGHAEAGLALLRRGLRAEARAALEEAERSYAGDFLEEDLYEDWAVAPREEARALSIEVARALAGLAVESGDHAAAARYSLRILERDPYDERAHLGLVSARVAARAHGEARRAYRAYAGRMEEIGVEPAPFPTRLRPALNDVGTIVGAIEGSTA
jgi:DNA-binding SARP family transcriptional activator